MQCRRLPLFFASLFLAARAAGAASAQSRPVAPRAPAAQVHRPDLAREALAPDLTSDAHARAELAHQERLARSSTIYRDEYGVPHIFGHTDEAVVFAFAYAQAEDYFWRVEENYIFALGRSAELYGEQNVEQDQRNRALDVAGHARRDYARLDPHTRQIVDAFAAGLEYYRAAHPAVHSRLIERFEPWHVLAFIRYNYYQMGFATDQALDSASFRTAGAPRGLRDNIGSNGWVVGPSRSASGHALLFINPHLPFFGTGQVYEAHLHSDSGWEFSGYTRFGFPFPYVGHNATLGWVSTDNAADQADVYAETFADSTHPLRYTYGSSFRTARERLDTLRVKTASGMDVRVLTLRETHHGPIVGMRDGKLLALRMAKYESSGWLKEWYDMTRAKTVGELKRALAPLDMLFGNVMAADQGGNTFYIYNAAVPRRDSTFDWRRVVDGSDPRTEWHGYHTMSELPQLANPATGWMQNCNTSPFLLTSTGNPDARRFPRYMVVDGDNPRGRESRRILSATPSFTFDAWTRAAFDTHIIEADSLLPLLDTAMRALTQRDSARAAAIAPAVSELLQWDRRADTASVATTLFERWRQQMANGDQAKGLREPIAALESAVASLTEKLGGWRVEWGAVNRLQRVNERAPDRASRLATRSRAVAAVNGADGAIFTMYTAPLDDRRRYGVAGATYVSVVEFGPKVRAKSVHVFGASGDPESPHFDDQSDLYVRGEFKPAWFTLDEVRAHARESYHPGALH